MKKIFETVSTLPCYCGLLAILTLLALPGVAQAQQKDAIGVDSATGEQYSCVRFQNKSLNAVEVINSTKGTTRLFSIKNIKRKLVKKIKATYKQRRAVRKLKKRAAKKLKKVGVQGAALTEAQLKKLRKFQAQVAKLDARLAAIEIRLASLKELRKTVITCKDLKPLSGSLEVVTGFYTNPIRPTVPQFFAALVYNLPSGAGNICAQVSGHRQSLPGGFSAVYPVEPPYVNFLQVSSSICGQSNLPDSCINFAEGPAVVFARISGRNQPGSCSEPQRCSANAAVAILTQRMGQMTVNILAEGLPGCGQDLSSY